ncbi:MAG: BREX system P-loop protein BrxC [Bacteroidia bacterium]|nr:BREX system P-loop protein BrxC [Bacteroidia bacterium]
MTNKELFTLNPDENNLLNDGVVEINTRRDDQGLRVIRHEIKTFVCEGEYQRGIYRILDTYLKHFDQPKQPAVWVSGFFGSGKSHLVKMLSYFWEDYGFPNGESARSLKPLPDDVRDLFVELDRKQKQFGKLVVAGTLKDFPSADIRYSFLQLLLGALGLPPQYHHFKFVYWARQEGIYDELKALVESKGKSFEKEYENLYVSTTLAAAVLELMPSFAENEAKVKENFKVNFKRIENISRDGMISTIRDEILPLKYGAHIPCTIIVLDEVQQFIARDGNKTIDVQNLAQDLCSNFDGRFLLIGTGQNALAETPDLQPLQDRFSVKVSLSDTDVETVTRKTVLEKKASAVGDLSKRLEASIGEISRNLAGTAFGYRSEDKHTLAADYPILPSTRRFWRKIMVSMDTAGTAGLLRSQLRIVDESVKRVKDLPIGHVIPADFVFEQKQQQLLQNALLLNETNNLILERKAQGGDASLEGRILSAVFLIDQLPADLPEGRLKSDAATLADLLIEDIGGPVEQFRSKVKHLVEKLVKTDKVLMMVGDEYKLQTKAGTEWEQTFIQKVQELIAKGDDQIHRFRKEKLAAFFREKAKAISILHGESKEKRDFDIYAGTEAPAAESKLNLWLRDGWFENEGNVMNEIRAEGPERPLAYAYVFKSREADLRQEIIQYLAAEATLQIKGIPSTPEGEQARKSMETRRSMALAAIGDLIERIGGEAGIFLAGGNQIDRGNLTDNIRAAFSSLADRQFPAFAKADTPGWDKALRKAAGGDPDALKQVKFSGEPKDHPVCLDILRFIGKETLTGSKIRERFRQAPYGWPQDAIDACILMLRNTDHLSTSEPSLSQSTIGKASFKKEIHTLSAPDKIKLRKLYQTAGVSFKPNEEFPPSNTLLALLKDLAGKASGQPPLPPAIGTAFLKDIENLDGNERLLRILDEEADLMAKFQDWTRQAALAAQRLPNWRLLEELAAFATGYPDGEALAAEVDAIRDDRLLLHDPDLVEPLLHRATELLGDKVMAFAAEYNRIWQTEMADLQTNVYFLQLSPEQKHAILARHSILKEKEVRRLSAHELSNALSRQPLHSWKDAISALPPRFQAALADAVRLAEPQAATYALPRKTLSSPAEIEAYLAELRTQLQALLQAAKSVILK